MCNKVVLKTIAKWWVVSEMPFGYICKIVRILWSCKLSGWTNKNEKLACKFVRFFHLHTKSEVLKLKTQLFRNKLWDSCEQKFNIVKIEKWNAPHIATIHFKKPRYLNCVNASFTTWKFFHSIEHHSISSCQSHHELLFPYSSSYVGRNLLINNSGSTDSVGTTPYLDGVRG